MKMFKSIGLLFALGVTFILIGCKEEKSSDIKPQTSTQNSITVQHRLGKTEVKLSPKTVVVFDYGALDTLRALDVNVTALPKEPLPKYLGQFTQDNYINVGSLKEPNLEEISRLSPDLIIISGRQADIYPELTKIAPTLLLGVDNKAYVRSMIENIKLLGQIFEKENDAAKLVSHIETRLAEFTELTSHQNQDQSLKTLAMIITESNLNAFGPGSRFGLLYDELGFIPVDSTLEITNHGQKVTYEYLIDKNPDVIFVLDRGEAMGQNSTAKEIISNPLLKNVSAIKNNRVIYLTGEAWYLSAGGYEGFQIILDDVSSVLTGTQVNNN